LTIENMTWDEKLRAMEELWRSLSREEARLESPPWHEESLRETAARHDAGKEQPVDWEAAKRELRERAERKSRFCRRRSRIWTAGGDSMPAEKKPRRLFSRRTFFRYRLSGTLRRNSHEGVRLPPPARETLSLRGVLSGSMARRASCFACSIADKSLRKRPKL
jgi:Putative addiction module component